MAKRLKRESARPDRIRIAGKTYEIVPVHGESPAGHPAGLWDPPACGYISHKDLKIYVNVDWAEDQIRDTILHETLHGCESAAGLEIPEQYVHAISTLLLDALKNNEGLVEYLTSGDSDDDR